MKGKTLIKTFAGIALSVLLSSPLYAQVPRAEGEQRIREVLQEKVGGTVLNMPLYFGENEFLFAAYTNQFEADSSFAHNVNQVGLDYLATNADTLSDRADLKANTFGLTYHNFSEQQTISDLDSVVNDYIDEYILGRPVSIDETFVPKNFQLSQNYPNPFNSDTNIDYYLETSGDVKLTIHDIRGRSTTVLVDGYESEGKHSISYQPKTASEVLIYTLEFENRIDTKKMLLLKWFVFRSI